MDRSKIVVGKPSTIGNSSPSQMTADELSTAFAQEFESSNWYPGLMVYERASDFDG